MLTNDDRTVIAAIANRESTSTSHGVFLRRLLTRDAERRKTHVEVRREVLERLIIAGIFRRRDLHSFMRATADKACRDSAGETIDYYKQAIAEAEAALAATEEEG